ncbi:MAG: hypothetical protein RLZZ219_1426 [Cyanobacteriota bacterium]
MEPLGDDRSSAWLQDLIASSSELIQIADHHGRIEQVNPAWCDALGYAAAEVIGLEQQCLLAPDEQPSFGDRVAAVLGGKGSADLRCRMLRARGDALELEGSLALWHRPPQPPLLRLILRRVDGQDDDRPVDESLERLEREVALRTAELSRSRQLLQEAQRIAQVGSWSLDLRRGELLWSDEIYRIFELDPARFEPSYEMFLQCVHPDDRSLVDQAYSRSLIDRQPYAVNHRLLMPDGRIKIIAERCETSFSDDGEPLISIGTALDITEPTLARERLEMGERKLRSLVELAPLGITLSDLNGEVLDCNPAFASIIGTRLPSVLPLNLHQITPEEHQAVDRRMLAELRQRGRSGPWHKQLRRRDGQLRDVKVNALLIDMAGSEPQVWSIVEDITDNLRIQDQLEQAASVFSHSHEGIIITDTTGKILDVNRALCTITGYNREQLIGSNPRRLKSGLHDEAFYAQMWTQLKEQGTWSGEVINRARNGTLLPVQETISAVYGADGRVRRYVALLTDIRELKQQQQQLEDLALRDPLTGLANRTLLSDRLDQAIHQTLRCPDGCLLVGLLDLDGFKQVNDRHGHAAGDHLLQVLAGRMLEVVRNGDTLARLGGDEFVLVLPGLQTEEQAQPVIERVLEVVRQTVSWRGQSLEVSASIGLCCLRGGDPALKPLELLRRADQAMYVAKGERGNRWKRFSAIDEPATPT